MASSRTRSAHAQAVGHGAADRDLALEVGFFLLSTSSATSDRPFSQGRRAGTEAGAAHLNLGLASRTPDRLDDAMPFFLKAAELDPKSSAGPSHSVCLHSQKQFNEALRALRRQSPSMRRIRKPIRPRLGLAGSKQYDEASSSSARRRVGRQGHRDTPQLGTALCAVCKHEKGIAAHAEVIWSRASILRRARMSLAIAAMPFRVCRTAQRAVSRCGVPRCPWRPIDGALEDDDGPSYCLASSKAQPRSDGLAYSSHRGRRLLEGRNGLVELFLVNDRQNRDAMGALLFGSSFSSLEKERHRIVEPVGVLERQAEVQMRRRQLRFQLDGPCENGRSPRRAACA